MSPSFTGENKAFITGPVTSGTAGAALCRLLPRISRQGLGQPQCYLAVRPWQEWCCSSPDSGNTGNGVPILLAASIESVACFCKMAMLTEAAQASPAAASLRARCGGQQRPAKRRRELFPVLVCKVRGC